MLSRDQVNGGDEDRVHGGRFLYMPKSEFKGKRKNEIDFNKQRSRHPDKFLGIDLREYRALTLPKTDSDQLKYQVGKNELKKMPLSPDPK